MLPVLALAAAVALALPPGATAQVVPVVVPSVIGSFCDAQSDFQTVRTPASPTAGADPRPWGSSVVALVAQDLSGGAQGPALNYTLCMDVAKSSYSITCIKGTPCPPGPDVAKAVYAGSGETYNVD